MRSNKTPLDTLGLHILQCLLALLHCWCASFKLWMMTVNKTPLLTLGLPLWLGVIAPAPLFVCFFGVVNDERQETPLITWGLPLFLCWSASLEMWMMRGQENPMIIMAFIHPLCLNV